MSATSAIVSWAGARLDGGGDAGRAGGRRSRLSPRRRAWRAGPWATSPWDGATSRRATAELDGGLRGSANAARRSICILPPLWGLAEAALLDGDPRTSGRAVPGRLMRGRAPAQRADPGRAVRGDRRSGVPGRRPPGGRGGTLARGLRARCLERGPDGRRCRPRARSRAGRPRRRRHRVARAALESAVRGLGRQGPNLGGGLGPPRPRLLPHPVEPVRRRGAARRRGPDAGVAARFAAARRPRGRPPADGSRACRRRRALAAADRARVRRRPARVGGPDERRDRRLARDRAEDGEQPRRAHPGQARAPRGAPRSRPGRAASSGVRPRLPCTCQMRPATEVQPRPKRVTTVQSNDYEQTCTRSRSRRAPPGGPVPMTQTAVPAADRPHRAAKRYIYAWGGGAAEGDATMRDLLGGKGAGLAEMTNAGLPVPPGFTITTEACNDYFTAGEKLPDGLWDDVLEAVKEVEARTGKGFGNAADPLLVSVRSGAKFSMPGMMDTVLNLGLNEQTLNGLIALTGNERFGWDAYRRFIQMFGRIVMDVKAERFDHALDAAKERHGAKQDTDLDAAALRELVEDFEADRPRGHRPRLPERSERAARPGHQGRLRQLVRQACRGLPEQPEDRPRPRHRGQRGDHGLRQHGRRLGDRRRLHPRPEHRREGALRRVPHQRPGRGRRRRHPDRAEDQPDADRHAGGLRRVPEDRPAAREALPRRPGPRVHDRARQALHAPDPVGQADRRRGRQDRGRLRGRGPDHQGRGARPDRAGARRPAPARPVRPQGSRQGNPPRQGPQCLARRGRRQGRVRCRHRGRVGRQGRARRARPGRDLARRLPRDGRRAGHPDRPRRGHQPCRRRRPPDRQAVRRRLPRARGRLRDRVGRGQRRRPSRRATGSASTARPARSSSARCRPSPPGSRTSPSSRPSSAGPTRSAGCRSGPTPTSPKRRPSPGPTARRGSACAGPSTCSARASGSRSSAGRSWSRSSRPGPRRRPRPAAR